MSGNQGDFLEQDRAKRDEASFQQEYICRFREMEGALFSQESIDAAFVGFEPLGSEGSTAEERRIRKRLETSFRMPSIRPM
jgi:hypothetical protein